MPEPLMPDTIDLQPALEPETEPQLEPRSRRALLAGGLGGLAGLLAGALTRPLRTRAAAGDPLILGSTTNISGSAGTKVISSVNGNAFAVSQTGSGNSANGIRGDAKDGTGGVFTSTNNNALFATVASPNRSAIFGRNAAASAGTGAAGYFDGGANLALRAIADRPGQKVVDIENLAPGGDGLIAAAAGNGSGVIGVSDTGEGVIGVGFGGAAGAQGINWAHGPGVSGFSSSGTGVAGQSSSGTGVVGQSSSGTGVRGASGGTGIGVFGTSPSNWSGYFEIDARVENDFQVGGNASVAGSLSKGGGSFRIDHPLDPANRYLQHSFVESPDMLNVYSGTVTADAAGEASIGLPDWFEALNRDVRYQLTPIGAAMPDLHVSRELQGLSFGIAGAKPGSRVSWQLAGIRQDAWAEANRIVVELDKPAAERGRYLHPEAHGRQVADGIGHAVHERAMASAGPLPEATDVESASRTSR